MRFAGLILLIVSFSAHAKWPPAGEILLLTGYANTNSWDDVRYPVFFDEKGDSLEIEFETPKLLKTWKEMSETGPAHVTLIGARNGEVFQIFAVEKYIEDTADRENSTGSLRYRAMQAWSTLTAEIAKNTVWMGTFRSADANRTARHNALSLLLAGNFIEYIIASTKDRDFLTTIISIGKLAKEGIKESQIKPYLAATTDLLKLAQPQKPKNPCSELLTHNEYKSVASNLERQLTE